MNMMFNLSVNPIAAFILNVVIVTSLILLVGEMIPKVYASKKAKSIAIMMAPVLKALIVIFKPLSKIFVSSTSFIDKKLAKKPVLSRSVTFLQRSISPPKTVLLPKKRIC